MRMRTPILLLATSFILAGFASCSGPLPWPESPLYAFPESAPGQDQPATLEEAMRAIEGVYAHYDVVAYEDVTTRTPMRTFVISYGFTEFRIQDGRLLQIDRFCHAEQKVNQQAVEIVFSDEATRAIQPRVQEVDLQLQDGRWHLHRPATPSLLGIEGDPSLPLSDDPNDANLTDPDGDGNPGVTVQLRMGRLLDGEIYIARREIYSNHLVLNSDGSLTGYVVDESEQLVVGASHRILRQQSNPVQHPDPGMNPVILIPVDGTLDSCDELMDLREELFPVAPSFL